MRDDARRAVATLLMAIAGVAAAFAAVAGAGHPGWLVACIAIAVVAATLAVAAALPDVKMMLEGRLKVLRFRRSRALPPPGAALPVSSPVITDTWQYTSEGEKARAAMMATESVMPGIGNTLQPGDRPPWIRFVVLIPCSQIGPDAEPGQLWPYFERFLKNQPVISLVNGLTRPVSGVRWRRWASRSAGAIQAVFTPGPEDEAVASARLELPDGTRRYFHDFASAVLLLHFEPPAGTGNSSLPAGPVAWTDHIMRALELPNALNRLLTQDLGLSTSGDPQVVVAVRLDAPSDLAEIMDITDLTKLPGGQHGRQAIGYFVADPAGAPPAEATTRMINHVLMYGLQAER